MFRLPFPHSKIQISLKHFGRTSSYNFVSPVFSPLGACGHVHSRALTSKQFSPGEIFDQKLRSVDEFTGCSYIHSTEVEYLSTPEDFYRELLLGIKNSKNRISLASLYVGNGELEREMIDTIRAQLSKESGLEVALQLDACRTLRAFPETSLSSTSERRLTSSAKELLRLYRPLSEDATAFEERVRIGLSLMPQQRLFPAFRMFDRLREGLGVFHMKAYVFDDHTMILSGANLSSDYFTNRQDRYIRIKRNPSNPAFTKDLIQHVHRTIDRIALLDGSHLLRPNGRVDLVSPSFVSTQSANMGELPTMQGLYLPNLKYLFSYSKGLRQLASELGSPKPTQEANFTPPADPSLVRIAMYFQLGALGINSADSAITALLKGLPLFKLPPLKSSRCSPAPLSSTVENTKQSRESVEAVDDSHDYVRFKHLDIASGYFNMSESLKRKLIPAMRSGLLRVLTAAPSANGFYTASGMSALIPWAYSVEEEQFYRMFKKECEISTQEHGGMKELSSAPLSSSSSVSTTSTNEDKPSEISPAIVEYSRPGWTFHAKGLWLFGSTWYSDFVYSIVGSSNFGARGELTDLDVQFEMCSSDESFCNKMKQEVNWLFCSHGQRITDDLWRSDERTFKKWSITRRIKFEIARRFVAPFL